MPPQHGKSQHTTIRYAAWRLVCDPSLRIGIASYNQELANNFSREIRRIIDEFYPELLSNTRNAVEDWQTAYGGGVRAAGICGGITGRTLDLIILDDPIKNRLEANSPLQRERLWNEYTNSWKTRLTKNAPIILIQTRWHDDDLAGRVKEREPGEWEFVNIPAIAEENDILGREEGEALCPDLHPIGELLLQKRSLGNDFFALYQGRPQAQEGNIIQRQWFRYWKPIADNPDLIQCGSCVVSLSACAVYITVDLAISEKTEADYTVAAVWAVPGRASELAGHMILLDRLRDRINGPAIVNSLKSLHEKYDADYTIVEKVAFQVMVIQYLRRENVPVKPLPPKGDKMTRLQAAAVRYEAGAVWHPRHVSWINDWEDELLQFPNAAHDDICDVTSMGAEIVGKHYNLRNVLDIPDTVTEEEAG